MYFGFHRSSCTDSKALLMADVTEQEGILSPMQLENDVNEDVEAQEELTSQQYEAPPAPWRRAKGLWSRIKAAAKELKTNITTLWYASGDPRTPISAKLLAYFVLGIALSPIDIIPDFIPVLGILDDIILVPLGIWFAVKLMYVLI